MFNQIFVLNSFDIIIIQILINSWKPLNSSQWEDWERERMLQHLFITLLDRMHAGMLKEELMEFAVSACVIWEERPHGLKSSRIARFA